MYENKTYMQNQCQWINVRPEERETANLPALKISSLGFAFDVNLWSNGGKTENPRKPQNEMRKNENENDSEEREKPGGD